MKVGIVIRTYNEEKYLPQLLEAVFQQTYKLFEVIVVDSGSTDATLAIVDGFDCKVVKIRKEDFSFGRSLNLGCANSNADLFVFISAHCIPTDKLWLEEMIKPFMNTNTALVYGRQIGNEVTKFSENQVFEKYFPQDYRKSQGGFFCNNANSAIRRELWQERNFNEDLTGLEDMDWAKFFFEKGFEIVYAAEAVIYHIHEESWRNVKIRYEREAFALKEIMPEIHFNAFDFLSSFIRGVFNDFKVMAKSKFVLSTLKEIIQFRFCQFYGAYRGNHGHRKLSKSRKQKYFYP